MLFYVVKAGVCVVVFAVSRAVVVMPKKFAPCVKDLLRLGAEFQRLLGDEILGFGLDFWEKGFFLGFCLVFFTHHLNLIHKVPPPYV